MAFPLASVLAAAPGLISAAADIIQVIRKRRPGPAQPTAEKLDELTKLLEQQAVIIEELAKNNRNLVLAVRNNRILSSLALGFGLLAVVLAWVV